MLRAIASETDPANVKPTSSFFVTLSSVLIFATFVPANAFVVECVVVECIVVFVRAKPSWFAGPT